MRYAGIPFVDGGRDETKADCYGIVRLFLKLEFGIDLPEYSETGVRDLIRATMHIEEQTATDQWVKVERTDAHRGDVVLMWTYERLEGKPYRSKRHLGVLTEPTKMLHTEFGHDSVIVDLSHFTVRERLESFWRHRSLIS